MSFYITIKSAKLSQEHQQIKENVSVAITSPNNRIFSSFVNVFPNPIWQDAFVASGSQRQLELMIVKQKQPGVSTKRISSTLINLSKYIFEGKDSTDQITLQTGTGKEPDRLIIQVCYRQSKNFIGPIQFYRKGSDDFQEDQFVDFQVEGETTNFPFWKKWLVGEDEEAYVSDKTLDKDGRNKTVGKDEKEKVQFYKGAHKNRNIFSFCDQVYDDQKFTVVQNYYNDQ